MSGSKSSQTASASPNAGVRMPSSKISAGRRMAPDYRLVWVDGNIDETNKDCQNTLAQLRSVVDDVTLCTQSDECIQFLQDVGKNKVFVISSGSLGEQLVPEIHSICTIDAIYIFGDNQSSHEQWTKTWAKIKGVHTNITDICEALQVAVNQCNQDLIAVSFVSREEETSGANLNQLEPNFMYTQIFKEILLDMTHEQHAIRDLAKYCRQLYDGNGGQLNIINEFERNYRPQSAICWYTRQCFTYQMLNRALRSLDGNIIINMGFFIHDLHLQIDGLHKQQFSSYLGDPFTLYRGQGLSKTDFEKLSKTQGGLMCFNNFLSTSKKRDVSLRFARGALTGADMVGILFVMSIDPRVSSAPFANIREVSYFKKEEEILFSMHTIFRVGAIQQMDTNSRLYEVELRLTTDDDEQLRVLTKRIGEEVTGNTGWKRLGNLLLKIGQFDKAEELYKVLIKHTSRESEKGYYYHQLGIVKNDQGDHRMAILYYEKALEIEEKTLPATHPSLAASYMNIGLVYDNIGDHAKALSFYNKALEISEKTLPLTDPELATPYGNIGVVHMNMGEYLEALSSHDKSLKIREKTLPPTHPDLAASYGNIGLVYIHMKEYSKALSFYNKALEIQEKTLPPTHPLLATSYNNIAAVYDNMGEYSNALSFYNKALEIAEKTLPSTHPSLAISYSNIGGLYDKMGEYSKVLSFHNKALEIREKTLPPTHSDLAASYSNIGSVYDSMGEYSKALSFHNKALKIREQTLPPTDPSLAASYGNIGLVYDNMGECSKALSFHNKALQIYKKTCSPTDPNLATSYMNIGDVYDSMAEYSKALSFYNKALEIREKTLPPTHPDLTTSYNNIGVVYLNMSAYSKALSFHQKALEIREKTLPPTHPDLATSCNNMGVVYYHTGEYSRALPYFERALDIRQLALPAGHPDLKGVRESIKIVKEKLKVK